MVAPLFRVVARGGKKDVSARYCGVGRGGKQCRTDTGCWTGREMPVQL